MRICESLFDSSFCMGRVGRVVLIRNAVETLGYFSEQMAAEFEDMGFETYMIDYDDLYTSVEGAERFIREGAAALVTFNFIGIGGEDVFWDASGRSLWERYGMRVCNVLVDHPMYYHRYLSGNVRNMKVFCVDRGHVSFMRRFYPGVRVGFLPLAGNLCRGEAEQKRLGDDGRRHTAGPVPSRLRRYGVVFTANFVPPETFAGKLTELGAEYETFYRGILEELMGAPEQPVDAVMERHIKMELGAVPESELAEALYGLRWLDLYARTLQRGRIVCHLAEADIPVHLFGAGWEKLTCKKPENLVRESGQVDSAACVEAVRQARIALNILPWFRDGAHDRIFTAMLQGTLALTDASKFLRDEFVDGEELVFFSLQKTEELPELVRTLLADTERMEQIALRGFERARGRHSWADRARVIAEELVK